MAIIKAESGLDWIQFTYPDEATIASQAREVFDSLRRQQEQDGFIGHSVAVHGYEGIACGHVAYLRNQKARRAMLKVSSSLANDVSTYVGLLAIQPESRITRVDLQVTVWYTNYSGDLARLIADRISELERGTRKVKATLINGLGDGDTLYLGATSSDRRLRMYDKYKESQGAKEYRNAWRYEVQYRDEYARKAMERAINNPPIEEAIARTVCAEYKQHDIVVLPKVEGVQRIKSVRRDTSDERRIEWLQKQVAPTIQDLSMRYGWDYVEYLLRGDKNASH